MGDLFEAIRGGDAARVKALLDQDPKLASAVDHHGLPALTVAIYQRKPEIAALLEQHGAAQDVFTAAMTGNAATLSEIIAAAPESVNSFSADGWTPLHLSAFFGSTECIPVLLNAGAKLNERSKNPMENMPLHAAAAGRNLEIVRALVERGALVNARQHGGWTPLHAAAQNGDDATAELLIGAGADVQARAENNQSPLDLALINGRQRMVQILEHYGA